MDLSIIIPHYNVDHLLKDAVESVRSAVAFAEGTKAELIVVDDGSREESWHNVARMSVDQPIVESLWIRCSVNKGQGSALNLGIRHARGLVLMFLDADDLWQPTKVQKQLAAIGRGHEIIVGYAQNFRVYEQPEVRQVARVVGALAVTRRAMRNVGPFLEDVGAGMTIEWFDRAALKGWGAHLVDEVVLMRRLHDQNYGLVHRERANREYAHTLAMISDRHKCTKLP